MPDAEIEAPQNSDPQENTISTPDDSQNSIEYSKYGDLYILGKLWIDLVKLGLLGAEWRLPPIPTMPSMVPVVKAAEPPVPQRPPKMKFKDLPFFPTSPHQMYKDYLEDQRKCPSAQRRLIHESLLPHVKSYRKYLLENLMDFTNEVDCMQKEACCAVKLKKNDFKRHMRDPQNMNLRQAVLVIAGLTGYYLGSGKGIPRRVFFTSAGLLAAGALCFPKDTDDTFRAVSYTTGKFFIAIYNSFCGKEFTLRERLPCKSDLPEPKPPKKRNYCPQKK